MLEKSSELIQSGDVIKTSNGSSQDRVMFLFDHQLVYCKKVWNQEERRKNVHEDCYPPVKRSRKSTPIGILA